MTFEEIGLHELVLEGLSCMGFEKATPIQEQAIPEVLKGRDIIGCAQTGTGKTAAFVLPILNKILEKDYKNTSTLIIVPTRELALQIDQQIQGLAYFTGATSICLYGGGKAGDWKEQKKAMDQGVDIIIATPGKLISHLIMKSINVSTIENLIFDEADRMLDMGFYEDICRIISFLPEKRQNLMFSATMPPKIRDLAKRFLTNPFEVSIEISKPSAGVLQAAYLTFDNQKTPLISSLIKGKDEYKSILIFTSTKRKVNDIVKSLRGNGYDVKGISSDLEQQEREDVLMAFTTKKVRVLVATDVISRGIDIKDINLVINYDVPGNPADYVHRIGRTARADTTGVAITLINPDDIYKFRNIETLIENEVPKVKLPEVLGDGPEWKKTSSKGKNHNGGKKKFQGKKKFYGKKKH
ncbi:DEAD/DEAH box helicase [Flavobacteriales bacterium]|nr:DEAD/DEAH box helicase [Flavobacteriales bacterium]